MQEHKTIPKEIDKYLSDIKKLDKIGKIYTLEVEITSSIDLDKELITYGGVFKTLNSIFINYTELSNEDLKNILWYIFFSSSDNEFIEGIMIHMDLPLNNEKYKICVEINNKTNSPQIISISEKEKYFGISQSFKLRWYTFPNPD